MQTSQARGTISTNICFSLATFLPWAVYKLSLISVIICRLLRFNKIKNNSHYWITYRKTHTTLARLLLYMRINSSLNRFDLDIVISYFLTCSMKETHTFLTFENVHCSDNCLHDWFRELVLMSRKLFKKFSHQEGYRSIFTTADIWKVKVNPSYINLYMKDLPVYNLQFHCFY